MNLIGRCFFVVVTGFLLAASPSSAADFKRINKKTEFDKIVVNKTLVANWGWSKMSSDGTVIGDYKGNALKGNWKWQGRFYCRNLRVGSEDRGYGCLSVHVSGKDIVFIQDKGKGTQVPMKIK